MRLRFSITCYRKWVWFTLWEHNKRSMCDFRSLVGLFLSPSQTFKATVLSTPVCSGYIVFIFVCHWSFHPHLTPRFSLLLLDLEEYYFEQHTAHHLVRTSGSTRERFIHVPLFIFMLKSALFFWQLSIIVDTESPQMRENRWDISSETFKAQRKLQNFEQTDERRYSVWVQNNVSSAQLLTFLWL